MLPLPKYFMASAREARRMPPPPRRSSGGCRRTERPPPAPPDAHHSGHSQNQRVLGPAYPTSGVSPRRMPCATRYSRFRLEVPATLQLLQDRRGRVALHPGQVNHLQERRRARCSPAACAWGGPSRAEAHATGLDRRTSWRGTPPLRPRRGPEVAAIEPRGHGEKAVHEAVQACAGARSSHPSPRPPIGPDGHQHCQAPPSSRRR